MNTQANLKQYDAIIIGSGAGGCAAAYNLVLAGLRVALVEKGPRLPQDNSTLDVQKVVHDSHFKSREEWHDGKGRTLKPEEYFNLGGKTKWYGAALLRYGRHEFAADPSHQCPGWPLSYDELVPFYEQAEALLRVREFDCEPNLQQIIARLAQHAPNWQSEPLPLGLSKRILDNAAEARHFDGFASPEHLKGDAETAFLSSVRNYPNLELCTGIAATELLSAGDNALQINGVKLANGTVLRSRTVLLAAGALHSPRLLQQFIEKTELTNHLPCYANVGRNLRLHLLTAMVAVSTTRKADLLRKTRLFLDPSLPHCSVQPLGFDGELISTLIPKFVPRFIARQLGARAYGFFLQTEDGAHPDNRVLAATKTKPPVLDYDATRTPAALAEHQQLVSRFRNSLIRCGMLAFSERIGIAGTAHASGTLLTGNDPTTSVVDANGQVHGLKSLYVVDGSVLPRSSRVNPSLTIYAWSLRVSQRLARQLTSYTSSAAQVSSTQHIESPP
jgi:choline dehydrogenase-like flavoprotein